MATEEKTLSKVCYTIEESARLLSISKTTLYRLTERGEIPHRRIGKRVFIDSETLRTFGHVPAGGVR